MLTVVVQPYRFGLAPAAITTILMSVMSVGTLIWGWLARTDASRAFEQNQFE